MQPEYDARKARCMQNTSGPLPAQRARTVLKGFFGLASCLWFELGPVSRSDGDGNHDDNAAATTVDGFLYDHAGNVKPGIMHLHSSKTGPSEKEAGIRNLTMSDRCCRTTSQLYGPLVPQAP